MPEFVRNAKTVFVLTDSYPKPYELSLSSDEFSKRSNHMLLTKYILLQTHRWIKYST